MATNMIEQTCTVCKKNYLALDRKRKHIVCSERCYEIIRGRIKTEKNCNWCKSIFAPSMKGLKHYCSNECSQKGKLFHYEKRKEIFRNNYVKKETIKPRIKFDFVCVNCKQSFKSIHKFAKYCSKKCGDKFYRKTEKGKSVRKSSWQKRRARKFTNEYETIDSNLVFDRDKWICHICKQKTLKSKKGLIHPKAPELDHLVTLAEGGSHTYNNVACCCRACNMAKGSKSYGQLFLFGGGVGKN